MLPKDYEPEVNDIICGRGTHSLHQGNQFFVKIIRNNLHKYMEASNKLEKTQFIDGILRELRISGSRFVKMDKETKIWYKLNDEQAHQKIGHAIQDTVRLLGKHSSKSKSMPSSSFQLRLERKLQDKRDNSAKTTTSSSPRISSRLLLSEDYEPDHLDVLCGTAGNLHSYPRCGNRCFGKLVRQSLRKYSRDAAPNIIRATDDIIRMVDDRGYRFLKKDNDKQQWYVLDDLDAYDKIRHTAAAVVARSTQNKLLRQRRRFQQAIDGSQKLALSSRTALSHPAQNDWLKEKKRRLAKATQRRSNEEEEEPIVFWPPRSISTPIDPDDGIYHHRRFSQIMKEKVPLDADGAIAHLEYIMTSHIC